MAASTRWGRPVEVYERPATEFVAGFVGVSNMLERNGRRFTVRPEKIRLLADGRAAARGRADGNRRSAGGGLLWARLRGTSSISTRAVPSPSSRRTSSDMTEERGPPGAARLAARAHVCDRTTGGKGGHGMKRCGGSISALRRWPLVVGALAFLAAGCGGDDDSECVRRLAARGPRFDDRGDPGERQGRGRRSTSFSGRRTRRWSTSSRRPDGCQVKTKDAGTGDEMITLIQSGEYDGVSASGHTSVRLMAGRRRRARQPRPAAELRRHRGGHQAQVIQLEGRRAVRRAARPRAEPT